MKAIASAGLVCALVWSAAPAAQGPARNGGLAPLVPGFSSGVDILAMEPLDLSAPVVDMPYSAETVTEITQQFADGNRVEQRLTGSIARDARGSIRREQTLAGFGGAGREVRIVTIVLAAERVQYRLDDSRKIAWRLRLPPPRPRRGDRADRPAPPAGPRMKVEQLASTQIEGLKADGTRMIVVIPQGSIGNQRTFEVVNERWYSPDLQTVVQTRRSDPRFGDVVYRLVNIVRVEPPASLFVVPSDFTVREQVPFGPPGR